MLSIYSYNKTHLFLRDAWLHKKKRNSSFSLRAWAKRLGFENNTPLSLMIAGKRNIPKKYIPSIIRDLELSADEGLYFENLIEYEKAKDEETKEFYYKRLRNLSPDKKISFNEIEFAQCLQNPIHFILLEAISLKGFKNDIDWIYQHVKIKITKHEVRETLERLETLGLIEYKNSRWVRTQSHVFSKVDILNKTLQAFHKNNSLNAIEALNADIHEREFNGIFFNINKEDLPKLKKEIREFLKNIMEKFETGSDTGNATYQMNNQFFEVFRNEINTTEIL